MFGITVSIIMQIFVIYIRNLLRTYRGSVFSDMSKIKCRQNDPVVTVNLYCHLNTNLYWLIFGTFLDFGGNGVIKILHICSSLESFSTFY